MTRPGGDRRPQTSKPHRRSRGLSIESLVLLIFGLMIGAGLAGFVLLEAWLLLRDDVTASPVPAVAQPVAQTVPVSTHTPTATFTPVPTIPFETLPMPSISGGTIATTTGAIRFTLTTGATIFVAPDTELELTELPDASAQARDVLLTLLRGRLLVDAVLGPNDTFQIRTPALDVAQVVGSLMGVEYDPASQTFQVDCLEGHCRMGKSADLESESIADAVDLEGGQYSFQSPDTTPEPPQNSRNEIWQPLGGERVPPPIVPTPDATAERADFCATHQAQFPTTPCP